jgi:hypothetical protein
VQEKKIITPRRKLESYREEMTAYPKQTTSGFSK